MNYDEFKITLQNLAASSIVKQDEALCKSIDEALKDLNKKTNLKLFLA